MANLSLYEVKQAQLEHVPMVDGQLIVVSDTGSIYKDISTNGTINRILIGNDVIVVDELPLAPISNKIYYLKPNKLYTYNSGWIALNEAPEFIQVNADYLQNDSSQPDYIKNRPFYTSQGHAVIVDNASLVIADATDGDGLLWGCGLEKPSTQLGDTVSVLYDGVSYELTKKHSEDLGADFFGNGSIVNVMGLSLEDTGEPFMFAMVDDGLFFYTIDTQEATHTVTISQEQELVKTLDIKYLPEGMAYGYESKPFEDITWDGNTDGLTSVGFDYSYEDSGKTITITYSFYKVSDQVLAKEDYVGAIAVMAYPDGSFDKQTMDSGDIIDVGSNGSFAESSLSCINIVQDNDSIDLTNIVGIEQTLVFPEMGTWFISAIQDGVMMMQVTELLSPTNITQIDKKFLPVGAADGIAGLNSAGKVPTEQLPIDSTVNNGSVNPVSGNAVYKALGQRTELVFDDTPISGSNNLVTSDVVYTAIANKEITIDSSVQSGSSNAVSGNAVYNALGGRSYLTIDSSISSNSSNPISTSAVYAALGNRFKLSFDAKPLSDSPNLLTSGAVYTAIENKKITVDTTITSDSTNAVSSGAVYESLSNKQDRVAVTTDDNGKFMRVVDGAWTAVTVPNAEDGEF